MGDDVPDLPLLMRVGLSTTPADGNPEVLNYTHWQSRFPGGRGAVRGSCRTHPQIPGRMGYTRAQHLRPRQIMIHRSLVLRERITAIVGAALLLLLVGASYYYSVQTRIEALKYVPSETSPDFTARRVTLTDFDERGVATARLSASTMEHFSGRAHARHGRQLSLPRSCEAPARPHGRPRLEQRQPRDRRA